MLVEIPLTPSEPQNFSIPLSGIVYRMRVQWRGMCGLWFLDLSDADGNLLVAGVAMVAGADIMAQYRELNFPGQLWIESEPDPYAEPTFDDLGVNSHFYYYVPD